MIARGLSDEQADRHYLIVDGTDGLSHYIDIGIDAPATPANSVIRITPNTIAIRPIDQTIATIAAANDGTYSADLHLRYDPTATETFARTHERRLEAIRRATGAVERQADGRWTIAPDHLARIEAYERDKASKAPVGIEQLSTAPLQDLVRHDGLTWLDSELAASNPMPLGQGFGREVRQALDLRRQWLVEQDLATLDGDSIRLRANLTASLRQRELRRVAAQLSQEMGLGFVETKPGQAIDGVYRRAVQVGSARYALIEKSRDFTLVPWRPVLDRAVGKPVSGVMREAGGISWTIGRNRGLGIE